MELLVFPTQNKTMATRPEDPPRGAANGPEGLDPPQNQEAPEFAGSR